EQLGRMRQLLAVELVCAAQAVDLAAPKRLGRGTAAAHAWIRELVEPLGRDRALGVDAERVCAEALANGRLLELVDGALRASLSGACCWRARRARSRDAPAPP